MVPGVHILLSPQEEEEHYSSWEHRCTNVHIQHHIHQKDLNILSFKSFIIWYHVTMTRLLMNWKKHKQGFQLC